MNKRLTEKLKQLPGSPGVYFHKNARGEIIYVGKAAVLKNRVRQYFQKSRARDPKTDALVKEIADVDWQVVDSEMEALFLEGELIRRYRPRYNILLRDDKSMAYIRVDYKSDFPTVGFTRRPLDDGARYFGPYFSVTSVRQALKILRRIFPFATRKINGQKRVTLHYHLGLDPGLEEGKTDLADYRANLRKLMAVIEGKRTKVEKELEKEMKACARVKDFEAAAKARNQLFALRNLSRQTIFSDKEFLDISKDHALAELVDLLGLKNFPKRIEGYDISHMSGRDVVASMVVFSNGVSDKAEYRKFKMSRQANDDFFNMNETISRRLSEKNIKAWGLPNLFLVDGGKGQLDAAIRARDEQNQSRIPFIGLAKREEQIVIKKTIDDRRSTLEEKSPTSNVHNFQHPAPNKGSGVQLNEEVLQKLGGFKTESEDFVLVNLPHSTNLVKLLQRIRDESHRFAVSYHSTLKRQHQTASQLEDVPGVGPATRKKLIKTFGSLRAASQASESEIIVAIGPRKAALVIKYLAGVIGGVDR